MTTRTVHECKRCRAPISAGDEEYCWHCNDYICTTCHDNHGHCGVCELPARLANLEGKVTALEQLVDRLERENRRMREVAHAKAGTYV